MKHQQWLASSFASGRKTQRDTTIQLSSTKQASRYPQQEERDHSHLTLDYPLFPCLQLMKHPCSHALQNLIGLSLPPQFQNIQQKSKALASVNQQIYYTIDRNEAYSSNYIHFHVLMDLVLAQILILLGPAHRIVSIMDYSLKKIIKDDMKKQLKQQHFYAFMVLILRKDVITVQKLHNFMIQFMREEREIMIANFPYYFNLFALVVNKETIFSGKDSSNWIQYTFGQEVEIQQRILSKKNVREEYLRIQKRSIEMYHNEEL